MQPKEQQSQVTLGLTRKSLEAVRIFACPRCGAPGLYKADERIKQGWPGCYDPARHDQPVGAVCPNCKASRTADIHMGELTASMPKWIWNCVLAFKWCLIKVLTAKRRLTT